MTMDDMNKKWAREKRTSALCNVTITINEIQLLYLEMKIIVSNDCKWEKRERDRQRELYNCTCKMHVAINFRAAFVINLSRVCVCVVSVWIYSVSWGKKARSISFNSNKWLLAITTWHYELFIIRFAIIHKLQNSAERTHTNSHTHTLKHDSP